MGTSFSALYGMTLLALFALFVLGVWVVMMIWRHASIRFRNYKSRIIDYGAGNLGLIYYKVSKPEVKLGIGGRREEWVEYKLFDGESGPTMFYLSVSVKNRKVIACYPMNSSKLDPKSKLQQYLVHCKPPEITEGTDFEEVISFKEICVQKIIDQFQY